MSWQPFFGESMDEKRYRQVLEVVEPVLEHGEYVTAILTLMKLSPGTMTLALTEHRLLGVGRTDVKRVADARDVRVLSVEADLVRSKLMVDAGAGLEHWGDVLDEDALRRRLLLLKGLPAAVRADLQAELDGRPTARQTAAWQARAERDAAETQQRRDEAAARRRSEAARDAAREADEEVWRAWDAIADAHLRRQLLDAFLAACRDDELPRTIITSTDPAATAIAAFDDRCVLVTRAPLTGRWMTTTITYAEITAIEFHADWLGGVLEILTTTYHGARWSRDPFTLANTLEMPMRRYPPMRRRIEQLQELAATAKPAPEAVTAPAFDLAAEIEKVHALHEAGVLNAEEFVAAKRALIDRA